MVQNIVPELGHPYVAKFVDYGVKMNALEDVILDLDSMMGKLGKIHKVAMPLILI